MNILKLCVLFFVILAAAKVDYIVKWNSKKKGQMSKNFILITVLYNEIKLERIKEYLACLEKNLHHPLIDKVHVIYDTSKDNLTEKHPILDYLLQYQIMISYIDYRPTYDYCFDLVNELYPQRKIIISNADIYFNETLAAFKEYDLTNKFIALTRWEVCDDGALVPCHIISYDAWIFSTPLHSFSDGTIAIGTNECDLLIGYQAQKSRFHIINPCLTVQCCHLHLSGMRNYDFDKHTALPKDYKPIRRSFLC